MTFLTFDDVPNPGRKTRIVAIFSKANDDLMLGHIQWHCAWHRYCFYPKDQTLFGSSCLMEISDQIEMMMKQRKEVK